MTVNGWIQILFFFGVILACTKPLGAFMHRVMEGEQPLPLRAARMAGAARLSRVSGVDGREQRWTAYSLALLAFSFFTMLVTYAIQRLQAVLPFNPQKLARRGSRLVLQHRRQLHHQHELAGVRRRSDHELPEPDGGPGLAQLHLRRRRDRRSPSRSPVASRATERGRRTAPSATSGSTSRAPPSTSSCPSRSSSRSSSSRRACSRTSRRIRRSRRSRARSR